MRRRTLKRYQDLYRNPRTLFPPGPDSAGVETILFPNGENEIWLQTPDGLGMRLRVSNGPAGLSVRVRSFIGTPKISGMDADEVEVSLCQYRQDARSQAFKRWYRHQETADDVTTLGPTYQRALRPARARR